jgi:predicted transposase YbfD/YdcC
MNLVELTLGIKANDNEDNIVVQRKWQCRNQLGAISPAFIIKDIVMVQRILAII